VLVRGDSPIQTPADLRGKKIATGRGSIGHYLLLRVLQNADLKPADVQVVFLNPGDAKAAFSSGAIEGWVTWGPYIPFALASGAPRSWLPERGGSAAMATKPRPTRRSPPSGRRSPTSCAGWQVARRWAGDHQQEYAAALAKETGLTWTWRSTPSSATGRCRWSPTRR
jgi:sulfonate transport system substrate-binding protein